MEVKLKQLFISDMKQQINETSYTDSIPNKSKGSDYIRTYFTENFQLKENKTRMRNIHPRFFICFLGVKIRV